MIRAYLAWVWACVAWPAEGVGYWVRPYDMLADARRWFWQARTPCRVMYEACTCPIGQGHLPSCRLTGGQWVARATTGDVIATSTSAREMIYRLHQLGPQAVGATARFEKTEVSS